MRGKWAAGIKPRFFTWVIKDKLAVCERPGGYARNHRKVRRREEILWLKCQGFTRVVSLLVSPHNLYAYDEEKLAWSHLPFATNEDPACVLPDLYEHLRGWLRDDERVVVHQEEVNDRLMGAVAGYLYWSAMIPEGAQSVAVVERLFGRQMGPEGRELVAMVPAFPKPGSIKAGPINSHTPGHGVPGPATAAAATHAPHTAGPVTHPPVPAGPAADGAGSSHPGPGEADADSHATNGLGSSSPAALASSQPRPGAPGEGPPAGSPGEASPGAGSPGEASPGAATPGAGSPGTGSSAPGSPGIGEPSPGAPRRAAVVRTAGA